MKKDINAGRTGHYNISQKSICLFIPILVTSALTGKINPYVLVNGVLNSVEQMIDHLYDCKDIFSKQYLIYTWQRKEINLIQIYVTVATKKKINIEIIVRNYNCPPFSAGQ